MASSAEPPAKKAKLDEQERQKALETAQEEYTAIEKKLEGAYSQTHQDPAMIAFWRTTLQNRHEVLMNLTSQKPEAQPLTKGFGVSGIRFFVLGICSLLGSLLWVAWWFWFSAI